MAAAVANGAGEARSAGDEKPVSGWGDVTVVVTVRSSRREVDLAMGATVVDGTVMDATVVGATVGDATVIGAIISGAHAV